MGTEGISALTLGLGLGSGLGVGVGVVCGHRRHLSVDRVTAPATQGCCVQIGCPALRAWRAFRLVTAYSAPRQDEGAGHGGRPARTPAFPGLVSLNPGRSARTLAFPGLVSLNSVGSREGYAIHTCALGRGTECGRGMRGPGRGLGADACSRSSSSYVRVGRGTCAALLQGSHPRAAPARAGAT